MINQYQPVNPKQGKFQQHHIEAQHDKTLKQRQKENLKGSRGGKKTQSLQRETNKTAFGNINDGSQRQW